MTRIEVLEKIIRQEGRCTGISCSDDKCPISTKYGNSFCSKGIGSRLQQAIERLAKEKEMKKFSSKDYDKGKTCMHCNDEGKALTFIKVIGCKHGCSPATLASVATFNCGEALCLTLYGDYDGYETYESRGYTMLEFDDFNWEEKKEKEMKFKVGDKVRGNGNEEENDSDYVFTSRVREFLSDEKEREVTEVNPSFVRLKDTVLGFSTNWLEKVEPICSFVKDDMIEVSNNEINWGERKFYSFDDKLDRPHLTISKTGNIENWKHAREIKRFECYEPNDFQREWIGEKIHKSLTEYTIVGLRDDNIVIFSTDGEYLNVPFSYLYNEDYLWTKTDKIFGKEAR